MVSVSTVCRWSSRPPPCRSASTFGNRERRLSLEYASRSPTGVVAQNAETLPALHAILRAVQVFVALHANAARCVAQRGMVRTFEVIATRRQATMGQRIAGRPGQALLRSRAVTARAIEWFAGEIDVVAARHRQAIRARARGSAALTTDGVAPAPRRLRHVLHTARRWGRGQPPRGGHQGWRSACTTRLHVRFIRREIEGLVTAAPSAPQKWQKNRHAKGDDPCDWPSCSGARGSCERRRALHPAKPYHEIACLPAGGKGY